MIAQPGVTELAGAEVIEEEESSVVVADCEDVKFADIEDELAEESVDDGEALMEVIEAKKLP